MIAIVIATLFLGGSQMEISNVKPPQQCAKAAAVGEICGDHHDVRTGIVEHTCARVACRK